MRLQVYDSWDFFQDVNQPLFEYKLVKGCNADQLMIDLGLDASDLINDLPANRFNELESQKLRDEPLPQAVTKLYDPSNVFGDVSHDAAATLMCLYAAEPNSAHII